MSKSVQIRDVPDDVHRVLRSRAARADMSLSDYLKAEVCRLAEHPPIADVLARAGARSGGASSQAIREAVRAARDRQ